MCYAHHDLGRVVGVNVRGSESRLKSSHHGIGWVGGSYERVSERHIKISTQGVVKQVG